jgi:hypothetical protein
MTPVDALAALDRRILAAYSHRTTDALRAALPLRIALPRIESFLTLNVDKEVRKDALVIRRAGEALHHGATPDATMVRQLFHATQEIDRAFLARVGSFPIGIVIRYQEIEPIRVRRIELLLGAAYALLGHWPQRRGWRAALHAHYSRAELEQLLHELLRLYAQETLALSRSLRLPALLVPLREAIAHNLYQIMNATAIALARELTATVHRAQRN